MKCINEFTVLKKSVAVAIIIIVMYMLFSIQEESLH